MRPRLAVLALALVAFLAPLASGQAPTPTTPASRDADEPETQPGTGADGGTPLPQAPPNAGPAEPAEESAGASWPATLGFLVGISVFTLLALALTAFIAYRTGDVAR